MSNILNDVHSIKVSPGIGMGRVGNSDEFFLGPETPGVPPVTIDGNFKDSTGALRRQAQRFRVFGYDSGGALIDEITSGSTVNGQEVTLQWAVHVTNMKAANYAFQGKYNFTPNDLRNSTIQPRLPPAQRTALIIDPGQILISGLSQGPVELLDTEGNGSEIFNVSGTGHVLSQRLKFDPPQSSTSPVPVTYTPQTVSLGELHTDEDGRLIFVGGKGVSESCTTPKVIVSKIVDDDSDEPNPEYNGNSYFNNPGWYDDTCGGSIDVTVTATSSNTTLFTSLNNPAARGWVAVAPPHYSPATYNVVSLLDLQLDIYPEADPYTGKGPIYYAESSRITDGHLALAESQTGDSDSFNFTRLSTPSFTQGTYAPCLTNFNASTYIGTTSNDGVAYIGLVNSNTDVTFTALDFANAYSGASVQSSPVMAVLNDQLYYAVIDHTSKNLLFAYGDPSFFTYGNVDLNLNGINADGEAAPALSAFNGDLYSAVLSTSGEIYIGKTVNGIIANFAFKTIDIPAGVTPTPRGNIALTYFVGKLYCAFIDVNGDAYLGSAADGLTYTFNKLSSTVNPNIAFDAVSLTSFNNKLYFAYNGQLGTSSDGETFQFSSVTSATGNPGIYTHVPVDFYRDIYPTLKTVTDYAWTNERAFHGHRPGTIAGFLRPDYLAYLEHPGYADVNYSRPFVFGYIRPPAQATYVQNGDDLVKVTIPAPPMAAPKGTDSQGNPTGIFAGHGVQQVEQLMPRLFGNGGSVSENRTNGTNHPNQWLPLTNHQLEKLQKWVNGDFVTGDSNAVQYQDIPIPDQLDFAALQPTVGGGFHPGIELTYLMHYPDYFEGPFRFNQSIIPGSIAGYMSVPWQGDFWSCNISWWPALRPDIVVQSDNSVTPPALTYENWFRGNEIPPESDSVADYEGGYEIMLKSWPEFGLVTPVVGEYSIDQGQQVYQETERASSLDTPSYLANIDLNYVPTGSVLNNGNGTLTVSAISSGATEQQWKLIKSSTDAGYLFIEYVATGDVLTADFSTGSLTLEPKQTPSNSAQHWTYYASDTPEHPTGQPGQFMLKNQQNLQYLSVDENGNVSAQSSGETLWRLQATS